MRRAAPLLFLFLSPAFGCDFSQDFAFDHADDAGAPAADAAPPDPLTAQDGGACDTQSDPNGCGQCGHSCLGGACRAGTCQPVVLAKGLGDSGGANDTATDGGPATGPSAIAADATHAYWLNGGATLMRVPVNGGAVETVASVPSAALAAKLVVTSDAILVMSWAGPLVRVDKTDRSVKRLVGDPTAVVDFAVSGADLFFVALDARSPDAPRRVFRCSLPACTFDPSKPLFTPDAGFAAEGVAASDKWVFVSLFPKDGSHAQIDEIDRATGRLNYVIGRDAERYAGPVADATNVFATNYRYIVSDPIAPNPDSSATGDKYVVSGEDVRAGALSLDDEFLYWQEPWGPRRVVRCAKRGCGAPDVLWVSAAGAQPTDWWGKPGAADGAVGLATTDEAVFFTTGDGKVMKLAKPPRAKTPDATR